MSVIMLSVVMLNAIMLSVIMRRYLLKSYCNGRHESTDDGWRDDEIGLKIVEQRAGTVQERNHGVATIDDLVGVKVIKLF